MLKDITLGQYFPGSSLLHRIDPRMKIILTVVYIVVVFLAKNIASFALLVAFTAALILISRIPAKIILRGLRPLLMIISFTAIINIFWTKGENLLLKFGFVEIYAEGLLFAALMIVRITALLAGTSVILTYTTSPIALTDGLERLLSPLKAVKLPPTVRSLGDSVFRDCRSLKSISLPAGASLGNKVFLGTDAKIDKY